MEIPAGQAPLREWFGDIDIYLFDQLLRGRLVPPMRVLDAGCGTGRNLVYLLRAGFDVRAVDTEADHVAAVKEIARRVAPDLPSSNFTIGDVGALSFRDAEFDAVISSAVLHFARDTDQFEAMLGEMWRVLRPGGLLFARLASSIGLEDRIRQLDGRRFRLPDGTDRFLVDESLLLSLTARLGGQLVDPIKTTNVQGQRAMTTWCVRKS